MSIDIFEEMEKSNTEQIVFNYNKETGLKSIIAINDTTVGPAIGGCRIREYESTDEALIDAIRLALGMTHKCSISGSNYGGGKTVVIADPKKDKNELLLRDIGKFVETLNGRYYIGPDVGTTSQDMVEIAKQTDYAVSLPVEYGGYGDPSKPTAYGVYMAMKASAKLKYGDDSLKNKTVAIQGVGKVGSILVEYLLEEGADVIISGRTKESTQAVKDKFPAIKVVEADNIYEQECHIFAPCALGGVLNKENIEKLKCDIVAGAANNQLADMDSGQILHDKGIIFAPDFVINTGGFTSAADTLDAGNVNVDRVMSKTKEIYDLTLEILEASRKENIQTTEIAKKIAEDRIEIIGKINNKFIK